MEHKQLPVIIIPAYQPSEPLVTLIKNLTIQNPLQKIIVVNDGSTGTTEAIFATLTHKENLTVLHHAVNLGKGQALKTAFNYYLLHFKEISPGVVTADADGQHTAHDIHRLSSSLMESPDTFWLGSRKMDSHTPWRSRIGNELTRRVFRWIVGQSVYDTQTGLRAIPRHILPDLLHISASRYEYELDMLIHVVKNKILLQEILIETIYIDENKSSHFNPLVDSLKIYFVFLRYSAASIASAVIDFLFFTLFHLASQRLFFSLISARIISGMFNFLLCRKMIFRSSGNIYLEGGKYIALCLFSLALSYILILGLLSYCHLNVYFAKIIADTAVFLINFAIQKIFVFYHKNLEE